MACNCECTQDDKGKITGLCGGHQAVVNAYRQKISESFRAAYQKAEADALYYLRQGEAAKAEGIVKGITVLNQEMRW